MYGICTYQDNCFEGENCTIYIHSPENSLIFEVDQYPTTGDKCDCIIFTQNRTSKILVIEMKTSVNKIKILEKVKNQIESGIQLTMHIINDCDPNNNPCVIIPVLLHKNDMTPSMVKELLYNEKFLVSIFGEKKHIKHDYCGVSTITFLK